MGHVHGFITEPQVNCYIHLGDPVATPSDFEGLATVITAENRIEYVSDIGTLGIAPPIRHYTALGDVVQRVVYGPIAPWELSFTVQTDFCVGPHVTLAGVEWEDYQDISIAFAATNLNEDPETLHDPDDIEIWFVQGRIISNRRIIPTGAQSHNIITSLIDEGPIYIHTGTTP